MRIPVKCVSEIHEERNMSQWVELQINLCRGRRQWHPTPVLLPGKSHGRRSLVGCSPWGHEESDTTERLHFDFSLSCTGEGNGNPLQCSCLENPRDGGAWWAAVYGVAQGRTRLKWLGSSSNSRLCTSLTLLHIAKLLSNVDTDIYHPPAMWDSQIPYILPKLCDTF